MVMIKFLLSTASPFCAQIPSTAPSSQAKCKLPAHFHRFECEQPITFPTRVALLKTGCERPG
jgi:hypothetical protein